MSLFHKRRDVKAKTGESAFMVACLNTIDPQICDEERTVKLYIGSPGWPNRRDVNLLSIPGRSSVMFFGISISTTL